MFVVFVLVHLGASSGEGRIQDPVPGPFSTPAGDRFDRIPATVYNHRQWCAFRKRSWLASVVVGKPPASGQPSARVPRGFTKDAAFYTGKGFKARKSDRLPGFLFLCSCFRHFSG